jgi:hypothetical protein
MENEFKKWINRWTVPGPNPARGLALLAKKRIQHQWGSSRMHRRGHRARTWRGGAASAGSPFGLRGGYHHSKEVAPGKVGAGGAAAQNRGGGAIDRWLGAIARGGGSNKFEPDSKFKWIQIKFKSFKLWSIQKWPFQPRQIWNKILFWRVWREEQLSP